MAGRGRGRASTLPAWMTKGGNGAAPPAPSLPTARGPSPRSPTFRVDDRNGRMQQKDALPLARPRQFEDAPEPRRPMMNDNRYRDNNGVRSYGGPSDSYKNNESPNFRGPSNRPRSRSRDRDRGQGRSRERERSRSRGRGYPDEWSGRPPSEYENRGGGPDRMEHRSRSRDRGYGSFRNGNDRGYGDREGYSSRGGGDRYESYYRSGGSESTGGGGNDYQRESYYRGGGGGGSSRYRDDYYVRGYGERPASGGDRGGGPSGHDDRTSRDYSSGYDYRR